MSSLVAMDPLKSKPERKKKRKPPPSPTKQTLLSESSDPATKTDSAIKKAPSKKKGSSTKKESPIKSQVVASPKLPPPIPAVGLAGSQDSPGDALGNLSSALRTRPPGLDSLTFSMATLQLPNATTKKTDINHVVASSLLRRSKAAVAEAGSSEDDSDQGSLNTHLGLLQHRPELDELNEIKSTPIFTEAVRRHAASLASTAKETPFSQYGLLAGNLTRSTDGNPDPRIFWNIAAPSSFFICGSQGSGKSHTLSCLLENALAPCKANFLPRPLTGIVFHYDTFISDSGGSPCEVAWLSSNPDIKVRVLCPPTNIGTMKVSCHDNPPRAPRLIAC